MARRLSEILDERVTQFLHLQPCFIKIRPAKEGSFYIDDFPCQEYVQSRIDLNFFGVRSRSNAFKEYRKGWLFTLFDIPIQPLNFIYPCPPLVAIFLTR